MIKIIAVVDFFAHAVLMGLHLTNHAYPGAPSLSLAQQITTITNYTPWYLFHGLVMVVYAAAAFAESKTLLKIAVTFSWSIWTVWSILMLIWVVTAPVSWTPLALGVVMGLMTALARKAWIESES